MAVTLIVEDGTGLPNSNSYVDLDDALTYFTQVGNPVWAAAASDDLRASALIRATAFIDATYRGHYPGYRVQQRAQALEWPRVGAYTYDPDNGRSQAYSGTPGYMTNALFGYAYIAVNEIPREVILATEIGAVRELATPGILAPDLKRGNMIKEVHAGSVGVTYEVGAPATTVFQAIELALTSLLMHSSPYSGRVQRG